MAIQPRKGDLILGNDSGANNRQYDDMLGRFREGLLQKAEKVIQYHKDNIKRKNKEFIGVGVWDKVNSPTGEGTWNFVGAAFGGGQTNKFEGVSYDIWYEEPLGDVNSRRRIRINDVFKGKEVNYPNDGQILLNGSWNFPGGISGDTDSTATIVGQEDATGHRRILGTTDSRDYVHDNNTAGGGDDTFGGVKEWEFGQSKKYSVAWNIAKFVKLVCGVRKAQFKERMAKTDRNYTYSGSFPTTIAGKTVNGKSLKNVDAWYEYTKIDAFNGWTHFDPQYFSSTDNFAWEIMKKLSSGNLLRGPFGDYANGEQPNGNPNNANNKPTWGKGPNADDKGVAITAANLNTIFQRMEDEWRDMANAENRKINIVMDYCHTSCHASCHSTVYPGGFGNPNSHT